MKKITILLTLVLLLVITGCSGGGPENTSNGNSQSSGSQSDSGQTSEEKVKLSIAHVISETHPSQEALVGLAEEAAEKSNNTLDINVIPNGQLGNENDEIQQVISGSLDMALIQGISIFQGMDGRLAIEELPFLFENREQAYEAVDGAYGEGIAEIIAEQGIKVLAYWENGFRHFTNSVRPITTPEDMKGIKFRSAESEIRLKMFEQLDANAVPMAFNELFTALQQGTVGGQENPLSIISSSKFYEVQDYLSLSGHIWNSAVLIVNPDVWNKLSDNQKEIIQELSFKYRDQQRNAIAKQDQEIVDELKANGMKVNQVDVAAFKKAVKPVYKIYTDEHGDELLKLAQSVK